MHHEEGTKNAVAQAVPQFCEDPVRLVQGFLKATLRVPLMVPYGSFKGSYKATGAHKAWRLSACEVILIRVLGTSCSELACVWVVDIMVDPWVHWGADVV